MDINGFDLCTCGEFARPGANTLFCASCAPFATPMMGCITSSSKVSTIGTEAIFVQPAESSYQLSPIHEEAELVTEAEESSMLRRRFSRQGTRIGTRRFTVDEDGSDYVPDRDRPIHSLRGALVSRSKLTVRHRVSVLDLHATGQSRSPVSRSKTHDPSASSPLVRSQRVSSPPTYRRQQSVLSKLPTPFAPTCNITEVAVSMETYNNPDFIIGQQFREGDTKEVTLPPSSLAVCDL